MRQYTSRLSLCTLLMATVPGAAFGQGAGAFDGTYAGVSAAFTGAMSGTGRSCGKNFVPAPVRITSGQARTRWDQGPMEGNVTPQGAVVMHSSASGKFQGQIDAQGKLTGSYVGHCTYTLVWQKQR